MAISAIESKNMKAYFEGKVKILPIILIILGVCTIFMLIGFVLIAIGAYLLFTGRGGKVSDAQADTIINKAISQHDYSARAKELSGFTDLVRDPVVLTGSMSESAAGDVNRETVIGKDGVFRITPASATVLLATEEQLGIYQCGIDLITGNRVNESFFEVFYQDVQAVTVLSNTFGLDMKMALKGNGSLFKMDSIKNSILTRLKALRALCV